MALRTDREKCAHLLRRFGLGASEAELDYYLRDGLSGAIDRLLDYGSVNEGFDLSLEDLRQDNGNLNIRSVAAWWGARMLVTRRPLQEKMTLFWHDHFATSAAKVVQAPLMAEQNETLRRNATGKFRKMLLEVSQDPAMIFWLDNQFNVRGKPNENFARELMELFTLGIGHYTEQDVQEAARAFTGWTIGRGNRDGAPRRAAFQFRPALHDGGPKSLLGQSGDLSGEDVIRILCELPRTSVHIATKLWEWFVHPDPEPAVIERMAAKFRASDLDIGVLVREMVGSSEFYSDRAERAVYKNPIDFTVPTVRQLGLGEALGASLKDSQGAAVRGRLLSANATLQAASAMGMDVLFPPDVSGWEGGKAWISSATMVQRIKWADTLFGQVQRTAGQRQLAIRFNAFSIFAKDPTPEGAANTLVAVFDAPLRGDAKQQLVAAAEKAAEGGLTRANANAVAASVGRLIFGSPAFQFG